VKKLLTPIAIFGAAVLLAQDRPGLFFREDWKEIPVETPVTQQHVGNPSLLLGVYGPGKVVEGEWVDHPDLSRVAEIGWTDLMTGGGSSACSRVDWIEVYGRPVKRP
jgi:hypothetical protein